MRPPIDPDRLLAAVQRLRREACAAEVCVRQVDGALRARCVDEVPARVALPEAVMLGSFAQALWEASEGSVYLRRLPDGGLLQVAFDQRSTPALVRVRSLELVRTLFGSADEQSLEHAPDRGRP